MTSVSASSSSRGLARAAAIVFLFSLVGYAADVVTRIYLGARFGASHELDAFVLATSLPSWVIGILTATASRAYVPRALAFGDSADGVRRLRGFTARIAGVLFAALALACAGAIIALPAGGSVVFGHQIAADQALTVRLAQLALPSLVGAGVVSVLVGALYLRARFFAASVVLLIQKIVATAIVVVAVPRFGIESAAIGLSASWAIACVVLVIELHRTDVLRVGWEHAPRASSEETAEVRQFFSFFGLLMLGALLTKSLLFIEPYLASFASVGSVTAISYSKNIIMLPLGLISATIATALFPSQAQHGARRDHRALRDSLLAGLRATTFVSLPFMAGAAVVSVPLVRVLFQRGQFDARATQETAHVFVLALGFLLGAGLAVIFTNVLYALQETRAIIRIGLVSTLATIALDAALLPSMGVAGIALGGSVVALATLGYFCRVVMRHGIVFNLRDADPFVRMAGAGLISLAVASVCAPMIASASDIVQLASVFVISSGVFLLASTLLGLREWSEVVRLVIRK